MFNPQAFLVLFRRRRLKLSWVEQRRRARRLPLKEHRYHPLWGSFALLMTVARILRGGHARGSVGISCTGTCGIVLGVLFVAFWAVIIFICCLRRKKKEEADELGSNNTSVQPEG
ncbi:hypothetical protein R1flu_023603 [Riccia fluitans]|uniref:Uncharacterized protein n=1 Tax=Riccia fluitans TaxID=41844 RepID=A0ABD1XVH3_9MARC